MPTDISNALGTARQFNPQPDATYQPRLANISATQYQPPIGGNSLTDNIKMLNDAMLSYDAQNEKRMDEWGLEVATRAVNSKSPEDVAKLDVIDALQVEGGVDIKDNPYAIAYAEKARGNIMASKARQDYDAEYAESPAKSVQEEERRFKDWMEKYPNMKGVLDPLNTTAFNKGYFESNTVNQMQLSSEYLKKRKEESLMNLYANTKAQLSHLVEEFPTMQKDELTTKAQKILNDLRLMGLDPKFRYALIDDFTQQLATTGSIDMERLEQMTKSLTVQTKMDGSRQTVYDLIDIQSLRVQANNYQNKYFTRVKYDFINKHKNDNNMDATFQELADIQYSNPLLYAQLAPLADNINNSQEQLRDAKNRTREKRSKAEFKATAGDLSIRANLKAWMDYMDLDATNMQNFSTIIRIPDGNGGYRKPTEDELLGLCKESINYVLDTTQEPDMSEETRSKYLMRYLAYEPFNKVKNYYVDKWQATLNNVEVETDADGVAIVPNDIKTILAGYTSGADYFVNAFGDDIYQKMGRLSRYQASAGSLEKAWQMYVEDNNADPEILQDNRSTLRREIAQNGFCLENIHTVGGGDPTTVWLLDSPEATQYVLDQASFYMNRGYDKDSALISAMGEVKDAFMYYHSALIPKNTFSNAGTANDEYWSSKILDDAVYSVAEEGGALPEDVFLSYKSKSHTFTFSGNGVIKKMTLDEIKEKIRDAADEAASNGFVVDTDITADSINEERGVPVIGVDEDNSNAMINDDPGTD